MAQSYSSPASIASKRFARIKQKMVVHYAGPWHDVVHRRCIGGAKREKKMTKVSIELVIDAEDVARGLFGLQREEAIAVVCELDAMTAEVDFTEQLVRKLVESLKGDIDGGESSTLDFIDWSKVQYRPHT
jgi:hypothetical protein